MKVFVKIMLSVVLAIIVIPVNAQISTGDLTGEMNIIESSVPFLKIAPDSRSAGMGDAGVASTPDINSLHWNPAKYAFIKNEGGLSFSYSPWLRNLINDINLAYLTGFYRIDEKQVVSGSLRYFSLGEIQFIDIYQNPLKTFHPNEFAVSVAYSRLFSDHLSGGLAFRYINSNLTGGISEGSTKTKAGKSVAADISVYYTKDITLANNNASYAWGVNISNIGIKISYLENQDPYFIPTNLRLGGALTMKLDDYNSFTFMTDLNKLLVPTKPIYGDSTDILYGKDPNVSVVMGMIQSFYDAPGVPTSNGNRSVLKEELREINYSIGFEYLYANRFALRTGYFHEHATKGNRKFFTVGLGLKLNMLGMDFAYLVPTSGRNNPLANTIRISLNFALDDI